jgi:hypothetical protein
LRNVRIRCAPLDQPYLDQKWADEVHQRSLALLYGLKGIKLIKPNRTITTEENAYKAASIFHEEDVDLLLIQSINADSGILVTA